MYIYVHIIMMCTNMHTYIYKLCILGRVYTYIHSDANIYYNGTGDMHTMHRNTVQWFNVCAE